VGIDGKEDFQLRIPGKTHVQLRIPMRAHFSYWEFMGKEISNQSILEEETFPAENSRDITFLLLGIHGKEDFQPRISGKTHFQLRIVVRVQLCHGELYFQVRIPVKAHFCHNKLVGRNISSRSISEEQTFPLENSRESTFLLEGIHRKQDFQQRIPGKKYFQLRIPAMHHFC